MSETKREFLHALGTPLSTALMFLDLALKELGEIPQMSVVPPSILNYLEKTKKSLHKIRTLVQDERDSVVRGMQIDDSETT